MEGLALKEEKFRGNEDYFTVRIVSIDDRGPLFVFRLCCYYALERADPSTTIPVDRVVRYSRVIQLQLPAQRPATEWGHRDEVEESSTKRR